MARHLVRSLLFAVLATALALQGCGKPPPTESDRPVNADAAPAAASDQPASPLTAHRERRTGLSAPSALPLEQHDAEEPPPWLAELLHSPDPNIRIQGLDAWARQPGTSLDPVTYALVDSEELVRARAQEVLEQELARR